MLMSWYMECTLIFRSGALKNLIKIIENYKTDILAVQETRWTGQHILEKKECTMYYSCHNKTHHFGTGFIINKDMKHLVMDFQPVSMRLCKLTVRGRFRNYSIFSAHALTGEKDRMRRMPFMIC
jgi:exonuclease III